VAAGLDDVGRAGPVVIHQASAHPLRSAASVQPTLKGTFVITLPTREFVGLLGDAIPFALDSDDLPDYRIVRVEWDGKRLHASATDTMRAARSTWDPDDDDAGQSAMFPVLGGVDDRWAVLVDLAEAKELAKVYKLPAKEGDTPLTLDYRNGYLVVDRSKDTGHSAIKVVVQGRLVNFPNLSKQAVEELPYTGGQLAAFGQVRQRGPMTLTFQGPREPTVVRIGERFVGTLMPAIVKRPEPALIGEVG
jgi:hypothetical protein